MLHESSIYLLTSYTESFGIVLIEAMSHGVPCIAFDSAEGARELIQSGQNGYLIKNRSYTAFLKKVEDLIKNKAKSSTNKKGNDSKKNTNKNKNTLKRSVKSSKKSISKKTFKKKR